MCTLFQSSSVTLQARWPALPVARRLSSSRVTVIVIWGATGPVFGYSDTWQLIINTGTTIVTFLMVFLIQTPEPRQCGDSGQLDELIRVSKVKNMFVGIEHLTEDEIEELREKCEARARKGGAAVHRAARHVRHTSDAAG